MVLAVFSCFDSRRHQCLTKCLVTLRSELQDLSSSSCICKSSSAITMASSEFTITQFLSSKSLIFVLLRSSATGNKQEKWRGNTWYNYLLLQICTWIPLAKCISKQIKDGTGKEKDFSLLVILKAHRIN